MSSNDYDQLYTEALKTLGEKYGLIGEPYQRPEDGKRICQVQNILADDNTVFILAWGRKAAAKIERQLLAHEPDLLKEAEYHAPDKRTIGLQQSR